MRQQGLEASDVAKLAEPMRAETDDERQLMRNGELEQRKWTEVNAQIALVAAVLDRYAALLADGVR